MKKFLRNEEGLVTIEWVGIAAVMVLAAIAVTAFIMTGAGNAGESVAGGLTTMADEAANPGTIPFTPPAAAP